MDNCTEVAENPPNKLANQNKWGQLKPTGLTHWPKHKNQELGPKHLYLLSRPAQPTCATNINTKHAYTPVKTR